MTEVRQSDDRGAALVTGATGAIGRAIAIGLARDPGRTVVLAARDAARGRAAAEEVRAVTGNPAVRHVVVDLSRRAQIQALAAGWAGPLRVLVNAAAEAPRRREETPEGIERQLATNVLGYLWMTLALTPALRAGAPARVVNVASYWAGGLDIDDLEFRRRRYDNDTAYRQSKQADRMLSVALAERLAGDGIRVNACHPGDVHSRLSHDLGFGGHESPEQAARTPLWLATSAAGLDHTGGYFEHERQVRCRLSEDRAAVEALYARCLGYGHPPQK